MEARNSRLQNLAWPRFMVPKLYGSGHNLYRFIWIFLSLHMLLEETCRISNLPWKHGQSLHFRRDFIVELTFSWCCFQWFQKSGNITYNGHKLDEFCVRRTAAYISQTDNHIAELTVRETLDFAARCQGASLGFSGMSFPPFHSVNENFRPWHFLSGYFLLIILTKFYYWLKVQFWGSC